MLSNTSGIQIYENHLLVFWFAHADCSGSLTDVIPYVRMHTSVCILTVFLSPDFSDLSWHPVSANGNGLSAQWSLPLPHSPPRVRYWVGIGSPGPDCSTAAGGPRAPRPIALPGTEGGHAASEKGGQSGQRRVAELLRSRAVWTWGVWVGVAVPAAANGVGNEQLRWPWTPCWRLPAWRSWLWPPAKRRNHC